MVVCSCLGVNRINFYIVFDDFYMGVRHLFAVTDFQERVSTPPVAADLAADPAAIQREIPWVV